MTLFLIQRHIFNDSKGVWLIEIQNYEKIQIRNSNYIISNFEAIEQQINNIRFTERTKIHI